MAWQKAINSNPTHDNGACIPRAGTTSDSVTSAPDNVTQGYDSGGGSKVVEWSASGVTTVDSSRLVAYPMTNGQYVMRGYGYIGGTKSLMLSSGASDFGRRSIHVKESIRSFHIASWDYVTGSATYGAVTNDDMGTDDAARPTRAVPGELTYTHRGLARTGSLAVPLSDDYTAKLNG